MIYLYYPFDDGTGMDILDGLVRGVGNKVVPKICQSPAIGELYCDNGTCPGGLWNVGDADEVYVIGHSYSGFKVLADHNKNTIDQSEILKRLKACGLNAQRTCRINVYACYSAKSLDGKEGLAAHLASALKTAGFACWDNVWGYTRKVMTTAKKTSFGQYALHLETSKDFWQPIDVVGQFYYLKVAPHV